MSPGSPSMKVISSGTSSTWSIQRYKFSKTSVKYFIQNPSCLQAQPLEADGVPLTSPIGGKCWKVYFMLWRSRSWIEAWKYSWSQDQCLSHKEQTLQGWGKLWNMLLEIYKRKSFWYWQLKCITNLFTFIKISIYEFTNTSICKFPQISICKMSLAFWDLIAGASGWSANWGCLQTLDRCHWPHFHWLSLA